MPLNVIQALFPEPERLAFVWTADRCTVSYDEELGGYVARKSLKKIKRRGYASESIIVVDDSPEKWRQSYGNLVEVSPFLGAEDDERTDAPAALPVLSPGPARCPRSGQAAMASSARLLSARTRSVCPRVPETHAPPKTVLDLWLLPLAASLRLPALPAAAGDAPAHRRPVPLPAVGRGTLAGLRPQARPHLLPRPPAPRPVPVPAGTVPPIPRRCNRLTRPRSAVMKHALRLGRRKRAGIDCSGLVTRGLIDADLSVGLRTANPRLLRHGLSLWWHPCTAQDLGDGYGGRTRFLLATRG